MRDNVNPRSSTPPKAGHQAIYQGFGVAGASGGSSRGSQDDSETCVDKRNGEEPESSRRPAILGRAAPRTASQHPRFGISPPIRSDVKGPLVSFVARIHHRTIHVKIGIVVVRAPLPEIS